MGMNKKEVKEKIQAHLPFLKEKYHVKKMGIFGSVVRNEQKKRSDIDILVEFELDASIGFFEFIRLENYLSRILKKKVDLVTKRAIKSVIKKEILKETIYV